MFDNFYFEGKNKEMTINRGRLKEKEKKEGGSPCVATGLGGPSE